MLIFLAIFGYVCSLHLLLIYLLIWGQQWRIRYQTVLLDTYALERIRGFFQTLQPVLKRIYPLVDRLKARRGRPATDYRFQLRFLLWWKMFGPVPMATAVRHFNQSPELRNLLNAPAAVYTRFALLRFLKKLQPRTIATMCLRLLKDWLATGLLDLGHLIIDSFPVYSYLNFSKCLKVPKFDHQWAKAFFAELQLDPIVKLFPKAHGLAAPYADKLKCWIYHYLWDIPSAKHCHYRIFGKLQHRRIMNLERGWKTVVTYRNFLKQLKTLPNARMIEQAVLREVNRVLQCFQLPTKWEPWTTIADLRQVLHTSHRHKDAGISLSHCAAKHQTFFGRGGLIVVTKQLGIPLLVELTTKYKQRTEDIIKCLERLRQMFGPRLPGTTFSGDSEFGSLSIITRLTHQLRVQPQIPGYGTAKGPSSLAQKDKTTTLVIERAIARLKGNFQLEHPHRLGNAAVNQHLHLCWLCDLLLLQFNRLNENQAHPHSMLKIRG
jgi:hypothetical protein